MKTSVARAPRLLRQLALACIMFALLGNLASGENASLDNALRDYVSKADRSYGWRVRRTGKLAGATYAELILTSQTWQTIRWNHQLFILTPPNAAKESKHALLFIGGGRWRDAYNEAAKEDDKLPSEATVLALLASRLKTPIAILLQVPQQPIFDGKYEDEIIAHTFKHFLESGDPNWPLLLPMVKSAARAMDATSEYLKQKADYSAQTYTVTGASKRGWTTWLTGAVDKRATLIAPMVIDMLKMDTQMKHQEAAWGGTSYKISDYTELNLHKQLATPRGRALRQLVDPYSYRDRLLQPKLIIIGTNDHYWPLDALNLYWGDLKGPKHILYVPNNRHGIKDLARVMGSLNAMHQSVVSGTPLPKLGWKFQNRGESTTLSVTSDKRPETVVGWMAKSNSRDFRDARWTESKMTLHGDNWTLTAERPEAGYLAFFAEARYNDYGPSLAYFSTNLRIVGQPAKPTE